MILSSDSFIDKGPIPGRCAFAVPEPKTHLKLSDNRNPHFAWGNLPDGTQSLVLVCHDGDVPSKPDDVNKEDRQIPATLPRVDFYHWLLVDLKPFDKPIAEGEFSNGVTARGKPGPQAPRGARQGLNDYTSWFASDAEMKGDYYGYDGPCPPWNDTIVHHYVFTLYALDIEKCPLPDGFRGATLLSAIKGHILDNARITGVYTLNLSVKT